MCKRSPTDSAVVEQRQTVFLKLKDFQINIGKFDDRINTKFSAVKAHMEEFSKSQVGTKAEEMTITAAGGDTEDSTVYLNEIGDDVKILPKWSQEKIPEINIFVFNVEDIDM